MPKPTSDCRATERKHPWPMVRLGELGTMVRGNGIKRSETIETGFPCLRYGEIYTSFDVILDKPKSFVPKELFDRSVKIKKGDLVFTLTGENTEEIAKALAYLGDDEIAAGGDLAVWTGHGCDSKYLAYLMYSPQLISQKAATGNGNIVVHTSIKKLQQLEFPLPPLSVQREIVARLERELAAVEKMKTGFEALAETAKAEFKAELKEVFEEISRRGAETRRLGEIGRVAMCKRVLKAQTSDNGDVPFFKIGTFGKEPNAYISNGLFREFTKKFSYPKKGDVLISAAGTIGRTIVFDGKPSYFQDSNIVWLEHDGTKVTNEYLHCFYWSKPWKVSDGATIPRIYNGDIESAEIPLPSLPVQHQIVTRLSTAKTRAEKLEAKAREGVAVCETMRKAILKEAFDDGRASPAIGKATG